MSDNASSVKQVTFPEGLVGCSDWQHFVLLDAEEAGPVRMLQCLDDPNVGFFVTDPSLILDDYQFEIPPSAASTIGLVEQEKAVVLCTLVVKQDPLVVTANLLGPLVINSENGQGVQVVLSGTDYSARHVVVDAPAEMRQC